MRQGIEKLADLPVVASRSDSLVITVPARGMERGMAHGPWPQTLRRLNNTPHRVLKIHGVVEPPRGAAVSLPRPGWLSSSSTSRQCEAPRCRVPPHHAACRPPYIIPMVPCRSCAAAWGWPAPRRPTLASRRGEEGAQAAAPCCVSHRGTMPELRGSRLGERDYPGGQAENAAHGTGTWSR